MGSYGLSDNFNNAEEIVKTRIKNVGFSEFNQNHIEEEITSYTGELTINNPTLSIANVKDSVAVRVAALQQKAENEEIASYKLEHSFIGYAGKAIEPIVKPLGYDWKIGIAVITSFAAREVFVGTLATIYSVGNDEEETIKNRMAAEVNPWNGKPLFNLASGVSLLLFYAFAMQCMSTLAVVKRETNSWKWPAAQLVFMSSFAYIVALIAYQILK